MGGTEKGALAALRRMQSGKSGEAGSSEEAGGPITLEQLAKVAGQEAERVAGGKEFNLSQLADAANKEAQRVAGPALATDRGTAGVPRPMNTAESPSFASLLGNLVESVDHKGKVAAGNARDIMLGKSDNIHQAMISMQEAGVAFNLLVEVRNKLVESYKELTRMQV